MRLVLYATDKKLGTPPVEPYLPLIPMRKAILLEHPVKDKGDVVFR
jgi:hypothetical protein